MNTLKTISLSCALLLTGCVAAPYQGGYTAYSSYHGSPNYYSGSYGYNYGRPAYPARPFSPHPHEGHHGHHYEQGRFESRAYQPHAENRHEHHGRHDDD